MHRSKRTIFALTGLTGLTLALGVTGVSVTAAGAQTAAPAPSVPKAAPQTIRSAASAAPEGVRLVPPGGAVSSIEDGAVTRDGRFIVTGGRDSTALVWEAATGRLVRRFAATAFVWHAQQFPDGDRVIAGDDRGNLFVWSIATGKQLRTFTPRPDGYKGYSAIKQMALSRDGKTVAATWQHEAKGDYTSSLHLFDTETGTPLHPEAYAEIVPYRLGFSPDNQLLVEVEGSNAAYTIPSTIAVIEPATGRIIRRIPEAGAAVGFSPDKKRLLTVSPYLKKDGTGRTSKAFWFDWQTGTRQKEFANIGVVEGITLSPDGTRFASYGAKGVVREFSAETGDPVHERTVGSQSTVGGATYNAKGELLVSAGRESGRFLRFARGNVTETVGGGAGLVMVNTLSADGQIAYLVTRQGTGSRIMPWDVLRNVPAGPPLLSDLPLPGPGPGSGPVSSPGHQFIVASHPDQGLRVWNTKTGRLAGAFRDPDTKPSFRDTGTGEPVFSPDAAFLALPNSHDLVEFSTADGTLTRKYTSPKPLSGPDRKWLRTGLYLADNKRVAAAAYDGRVSVFDRTTGSVTGQGSIHEGGEQGSSGAVNRLAVVPGDTDRVLFAADEGYTGEYDTAANRVTRVFTPFHDRAALSIAGSPDGKTVAVGGEDGTIRLFERTTGTPVGQMHGHSGGVFDLVFSPDGDRLTSCGRDGTIRFFHVARREEILTTLVFAPVDETGAATETPQWMVYNRAGYFEGSEGATRRIHFADGAKTFSADQFYERYYRAGLLASLLGGGGSAPTPVPPIPSAADAVRTGAPPQVRIVSPTPNQTAQAETVEVTVEATEQAKGGVKAIRLYHNGRLVGGPAALRGIAVEAVSGAVTTKKFRVTLAPGANELRAVAYSSTDLESPPVVTGVNFQRAAVAKPALHVFSVGINQYKDAGMNLTYAHPDAGALADVFDRTKGGSAAGSLFASVSVSRLFDTEATGAAILGGIRGLQSAKPEDVVLIYLAGHGETAENVWYFLPTEMRQMALPERVQEFGIPWSRIEAAVGKIPARKIILIVDACKSGAIVSGVRGGAGEQQALAIMARAQGIHILTASNSQQYAGEVKALGHGILTYALLEGLSGKAGPSGDSSIMVRDVMSYVENRVPELSLQYRGESQYPIPLERGQNFPMASRK